MDGKVIVEIPLGYGGVLIGAGLRDDKTPFLSFESAKEIHPIGEDTKGADVREDMPKVYIRFENAEGFEVLQKLMDWCYEKLQAKEEQE